MHLGNAVAAHDEWKNRFRAAIAMHETLDVATISEDDCCELGLWLHGEGEKLFGKLLSHGHCVAIHERFHQEAGQIATAINAGKYADADKMLAAHAPFFTTSNALAASFLQLRTDAANSPGFIALIAKLSV